MEKLNIASKGEIEKLKTIASSIRCGIITIVKEASVGHIGGSLSATDILVALYFKILKIDPKNPNWPDCKVCPIKEKFISGKANFRVTSHYDSPCYEKAKGWYFSAKGKAMQKLRHTILEGIMGEAKNYHSMARAKFRGLTKVETQFLMTAAALHLKKIVRMWDKRVIKSPLPKAIFDFFQNLKAILLNIGGKVAIKMAWATSPE